MKYILSFSEMLMEQDDLFFDSKESDVKINLAAELRDKYTPRMCSSELDFQLDMIGSKSKADLYYFQGRYPEAKVLYKNLLEKKGTKIRSFVSRDLAESLARTLIHLGQKLLFHPPPKKKT